MAEAGAGLQATSRGRPVNISLATWVVSLATFALGVAVPFVYRRLTFDGIAIRALDVRATLPALDTRFTVFGTMLRIANTSGRSVIVDDVRVDDVAIEGRVYSMKWCVLADVTDTKTVHIPVWSSDVTHVPPIIMKNDTVTVFALELHFQVVSGDPTGASDAFGKVMENPFTVKIRLNGTYRRYTIDFRRLQPIYGYSLSVGVSEPDHANDN